MGRVPPEPARPRLEFDRGTLLVRGFGESLPPDRASRGAATTAGSSSGAPRRVATVRW